MMKTIILAALAVLVCALPAQAANCRWTPHGYVTLPGWVWEDGRCLSEYEWREMRRHHDEHEEHERGGDWSRHYHYDERH
jgi:hypothetical protein